VLILLIGGLTLVPGILSAIGGLGRSSRPTTSSTTPVTVSGTTAVPGITGVAPTPLVDKPIDTSAPLVARVEVWGTVMGSKSTAATPAGMVTGDLRVYVDDVPPAKDRPPVALPWAGVYTLGKRTYLSVSVSSPDYRVPVFYRCRITVNGVVVSEEAGEYPSCTVSTSSLLP